MSDHYPSTALILIRHAQARADDGSYDERTPLSDRGQRQAARLAAAIAAIGPAASLYMSPIRRAIETAGPVAAALGLVPVVEPRLAEFVIGGSGMLDDHKQRPDLLIWHPDHTGSEQGETLGDFSARVAACCEEIVARHGDERVVVVAHAGTLDAIVRWAQGIPPTSPWQHEFDFATASISEVVFWPRGRVRGGAPRYAVIQRVGDITHLGDLASDF